MPYQRAVLPAQLYVIQGPSNHKIEDLSSAHTEMRLVIVN